MSIASAVRGLMLKAAVFEPDELISTVEGSTRNQQVTDQKAISCATHAYNFPDARDHTVAKRVRETRSRTLSRRCPPIRSQDDDGRLDPQIGAHRPARQNHYKLQRSLPSWLRPGGDRVCQSVAIESRPTSPHPEETGQPCSVIAMAEQTRAQLEKTFSWLAGNVARASGRP